MKHKIVIIGSGPTGIGAAYRLNELQYSDWQIFEKDEQVGGLSASFLDDHGFTWDMGGHVLFSHYGYFDRAVNESLGDAYYEHLRESWIRILHTWVPYPFQNNIRYLPDAALAECLEGLREVRTDPNKADNFYEWMNAVFGKGIVKYFMEPYNQKVWGMPLNTIDKKWIGERVSIVDLKRIEHNIAESKDDVNWGPNNMFRFPKIGGTGAIFNGIAKSFYKNINFGQNAVRIHLEKKIIEFPDGQTVSYDELVNTMPLDSFVQRCADAPETLKTAAEDLVHNSGLIVGLGFLGSSLDTKCWMYFPEENASFYRVTNFHNYSFFNVPGGDRDRYFSLMCETTYSPYRRMEKDTIIDTTIQGLINSGMITADERNNIISRYLIDIPYSYPVPTVNRDRALSIIQSYLESRGVYSRGRFGAWKYEVGNMDQSFMQGVEVIDRILLGKVESTINGRV